MIRFRVRLWGCLALLAILYGCGGGEPATKSASDVKPNIDSAASVSEKNPLEQSEKSQDKQEVTTEAAPTSVSKAESSAPAVSKVDDQGVDSMSISAKGESPWNLKASRIEYDDSSKKARASSIVWNLLDKDGRTLLQLRGDAAVVNIETQGLAFEGPVHATGSKGEKIVCNKLVWDSKARKLRGSHGVKVVREGSTMTGQNMVASPDLKQVEVEGDVRVYFNSGLESNQ